MGYRTRGLTYARQGRVCEDHRMADRTAFAGVLAQVIPVAILAVIVEARSAHEARAKAPTGSAPSLVTGGSLLRRALRLSWQAIGGLPSQTAGQVIRDLLIEFVILMFLVFVEVAALLTAAGRSNAFLTWFAGVPGAIGVGVLLVLVGQLYIDNLAETYRSNGNKLTADEANFIKTVARALLWVSIALAIAAVCAT